LDEDDDHNEEDEEIVCIGAGLGGGYESTKELQVMKTKVKDNWTGAVFEEHERMVKHQVWRAELKKDVPKGAKVLTSTRIMKKRARGEGSELDSMEGAMIKWMEFIMIQQASPRQLQMMQPSGLQ
jgi:hypothetical protein